MPNLRDLPRNVWRVSLTSFFYGYFQRDVIKYPAALFVECFGVKTNLIGLIEGVAEATASILKVFSGWLSDKLKDRKWLAVAGYGISALAKPFFYFRQLMGNGGRCALADRVGKGVRTAPRDALVADSNQ